MKSFSWGKIRLPRKFHCPESLGSAQKFVVVCKPTLVFTLFLSVEPNNIRSELISIRTINYSKYIIYSKPGSPCIKRWIFCSPKRSSPWYILVRWSREGSLRGDTKPQSPRRRPSALWGLSSPKCTQPDSLFEIRIVYGYKTMNRFWNNFVLRIETLHFH